VAKDMLSSRASYVRETFLGSMAQFFIDLGLELEIW
jgi:hypothetical protein